MEEMKNYIMPSFSKTTTFRGNSYRKKITFPVNMLLSSEDLNSTNNKGKDFFKQKNNFFTKRSIKLYKNKKYSPADIKFPEIKTKNDFNSNNISKNKKKNKKEDKSILNKILSEYDSYNKKYNDITRYFHWFIKSGNNNSKIHINRYIDNLKSFSCISKNRSRKYCSNAFQRIKSIQ